ncbi:MAG: penicillin-binding transpeptidase domain-containing protein [Acidimicrobiales bacterium]|jgi:peptidoglycan glycosyltransferase
MNPRIRWVGAVLVLCFALLFVQLNNIQVRQANSLSKSPLGEQGKVASIFLSRGAILSADDKVLAYSTEVKGGLLRVYPEATATDFGQITGYFDVESDNVLMGIEHEYNQYLSQHESQGLLTQHQETDDVILTIPSTLQADAASIIGNRTGAEIVALNPQNGNVLAMYGAPSYDPNTLSSLNAKEVLKAYDALAAQNPEPFLNLASAVPHQPGSTFKTMDTAAIFDRDPSLAKKVWPFAIQISIKGAPQPFHNYGYADCGGPLPEILARSCDTAYAEVGLALGAPSVVGEAESFGWCQGLAGICQAGGTRPPLDLPSYEVAGATIAPETLLAANPPYLAYSAIGQYNDAASALSMALVAAGIADNGKIMAPHIMSRIIDSDGDVVKTYQPHVWKTATSALTAAKVRNLMLGVTSAAAGGTAAGVFTNLQSQGIQVAAKTGTAEVATSISTGNCSTYDWLIAMAPAGAGQTPKAVVAAEVPSPEGSPTCAEGTGATVAGPLVDQMLTDVLEAGQ